MGKAPIPRPRTTPFPRGLDPLTDETLPGYILRLAHRLDLPPARVIGVTGLRPNTTIGTATAILGLPEQAIADFALATNLSRAEARELLLTALADRYPPLDPYFLGRHGELRAVVGGEEWVLTRSTRYCARCLAGDGSLIQTRHGGPWRRIWRLPIIFSCLAHRRLLAHRCPQCQHLIHHHGGDTNSHGLVTYSTFAGLHPAQCRFPLPASETHPRILGHRQPCGFRLDHDHQPPRVSPSALAHLLTLQDHLTALLQGPRTTTVSCGVQTPAPTYFVDLRLIAELISSSWPAARSFAPTEEIADLVDKALETRQPETFSRRNGHSHTQRAAAHRRPPLPADECGALLATATAVLNTINDPVTAAELLAELHQRDRTRTPTGPSGLLARVWPRARTYCSDGLRTAIAAAR